MGIGPSAWRLLDPGPLTPGPSPGGRGENTDKLLIPVQREAALRVRRGSLDADAGGR